MHNPLAEVRSVLIQAVNDTYQFESMGHMSDDEIRNWLNDIVMADVEKMLNQRASR
ncbi:hypothetical protein [Alicyclobacillus dauci]|uniref:Fur-regulated basic protein A n=1 Tax=Alicyclobacillus dauci TaxID=1475485 RepID=A0ABY6Z9M9_9BACL|nr:hypothetical protein [Alicyclobacillus dauci]WAH39514.1 hypothetical protein NZD86_24415 [Alicyclobacillus dauci]WAH39574.1 hypothetical protein NZD86_24115 [Alicyclobacillus dauci]